MRLGAVPHDNDDTHLWVYITKWVFWKWAVFDKIPVIALVFYPELIDIQVHDCEAIETTAKYRARQVNFEIMMLCICYFTEG